MGYTQPLFNVRKIAGGYQIYPDGVTTDDLKISSNGADTYPFIILNGGAGIFFAMKTANYFTFYDEANTLLSFGQTSPDTIIWSRPNNNDLYLQTTGSGVLKFGTYTAGAATDSTGYMTVKDALGNTRKLMVQA